MVYEVPPAQTENIVREDSRGPGAERVDTNVVNTGTSSKSKPTQDVPVIHLSLDNTNDLLLQEQEPDVKSIKIETYDQKTNLAGLETDSLRTSDSNHLEHIKNLVPHPLPNHVIQTKQRPSAYFDKGTTGMRCDEFSCLNNGKCVDDGTVHRNKVRCDCMLGTIGEKCEKGKDVN